MVFWNQKSNLTLKNLFKKTIFDYDFKCRWFDKNLGQISEMHHSISFMGSLIMVYIPHLLFILRIINAGVVLKLRKQSFGGSVATRHVARKWPWPGRACLASHKACVLSSTSCVLLFPLVGEWASALAGRPCKKELAALLPLALPLRSLSLKGVLVFIWPWKTLSPGSLARYPHSMGLSGQEGK